MEGEELPARHQQRLKGSQRVRMHATHPDEQLFLTSRLSCQGPGYQPKP
jgi:hypothetical protein